MTLAAANGHVDVMTVMLEKLDAGQVLTAATALDKNGRSAMTGAAVNGRADVMMAMVTAAKEKGAEAAQIAEMFLRKDRENKNAIERMDQKTLAAVWKELPEEVQSQLIADDRFPAGKKTSVLTVFEEVAVLEEKNKALERRVAELEAAAQGKPPAGNAGPSTSDSPKLGQG